MKNQKGSVFLGLVIAFLVIGFFWLLIVPGWGQNYSEGERTVDVYKFSKKGLIIKSWEGQSYVGGVTSGEYGLQLDKFYFSIPLSEEADKQEIIAKIKECASDRDITCTIVYKQWFKSPISVDSPYIVQDVIINK